MSDHAAATSDGTPPITAAANSRCRAVAATWAARSPTSRRRLPVRLWRWQAPPQGTPGPDPVACSGAAQSKLCRERQRFVRRHEFRRVSSPRGRFLDCNGSRSGTFVVDIADETKPALVQCANEALVLAAVAERSPCRADAGAERRLRDGAPVPDRVDQLVLADDPIAVPNKVNEQIEHLRLDVNNRAGAPQLVSRDVDLEIGEAEIQSGPRWLSRGLRRLRAVTCQIVGCYRNG